MKCLKCNGEVIEIRGNFFCSQCGEQVDLKQMKQKLQQDILNAKEAKERTSAVKTEISKPEPIKPIMPSFASQKTVSPPTVLEEKKPQSVEPKLTEPNLDFLKKSPEPSVVSPSPPPAPPKPSPSASLSPSPPPIFSKPASLPKIETKAQINDIKLAKDVTHTQKLKGLSASLNIRVLLMVVISLNILVFLGIIYFFILK